MSTPDTSVVLHTEGTVHASEARLDTVINAIAERMFGSEFTSASGDILRDMREQAADRLAGLGEFALEHHKPENKSVVSRTVIGVVGESYRGDAVATLILPSLFQPEGDPFVRPVLATPRPF